MPNSLLNILPHHFHLKLSLLQEVFSIKNRFLTDWISFYGHSTTICIKGEILSSFIQDKISPLIFSWKVSLNIFSFKNRFWIDWISFYGHRTTICIKGEILSLCSNRLIQYFWPRVKCAQNTQKNMKTRCVTDRQTNWLTNKVTYRVMCMQLKMTRKNRNNNKIIKT